MMSQNGNGYSMATFRADDASAARDQAYRLAMTEAKAKAKKLADLAGVKLGAVTSVQESSVDNRDNDTPRSFTVTAKGTNGVTGPAFTEIPVRVNVTVQFAIDK